MPVTSCSRQARQHAVSLMAVPPLPTIAPASGCRQGPMAGTPGDLGPIGGSTLRSGLGRCKRRGIASGSQRPPVRDLVVEESRQQHSAVPAGRPAVPCRRTLMGVRLLAAVTRAEVDGLARPWPGGWLPFPSAAAAGAGPGCSPAPGPAACWEDSRYRLSPARVARSCRPPTRARTGASSRSGQANRASHDHRSRVPAPACSN